MTDQLALFDAPNDEAARVAIRTDLASTLFVEAGAGTGKTAALVDRVAGLVTEAAVPVRAIAAITFTEKAAAELRDRIRSELQKRADAGEALALVALDELDGAAIGTLHAFAQRILTEFPIEVGLPPRIEVRDEISSRVAFEARWRGFVDELLDDADLETTVLLMLSAGVRLEQFRAVAEVLDDNWDLLDRIGEPPELPPLDVDEWLTDLNAACAEADACRTDDDKLVERLAHMSAYATRIRDAFDDVERMRLLKSAKPSFNVNRCGNSKNWPDINPLRERIVRIGARRDAMVNAVLDIAIRRMAAAVANHTRRAVEARRAAGELEFHDLLVLARTLLRDPRQGPRARARLREHYQRLLVDEFQDTDPIQVEIAALLGTTDDAPGDRPWAELPVDPGRLFFVGDPKQSIYRFRRADIATFLTAAEHFADPMPEYLTCNFRTAPSLLAWINHVFTDLIQPAPGSQPEYRALEPARAVPAEHDRGVMLLGAEPHDAEGVDAAELRRREAIDVARAARAAVLEQWPVYDRDLEQWRAARLGDVCILLPARTSLGYLEQALDDAGVPYRAETSSLVYGTREIRDLLATLRAVDDPSDTLALVSALRSSVFGCGDDDLFVFHVEHGGDWNIRRPVPESVPSDHPVADAMRFLARLHDDRLWATPSELLERIVRERRVIEVGALRGRFRDVARRARFLIDQARAFSDAQGGSLRDYLAWAELQGTEGARVVEAVLPETDDDAVRILTIHGAKGLEFPIVICSGTTTAAQVAGRGVQVLFPSDGGCEVKLAKGVQTAHFELHQPVDEQMGFHEKLRLLYVACTRARDHLVVSVHRKVRDLNEVEPPRRTNAELLYEAARNAPGPERDADGLATAGDVGRVALRATEALSLDAWEAEHARAHSRGVRRAFVAATTLAHRIDAEPVPDPGLEKNSRDLELPPWNKGRYGTAIGRAVHGTLQSIDLATGAGIDETAAGQAAAEGVLGHEDTIAALARAAIASPTIARAATRPHWRETYVAVPVGDITIEGYIDLVFRDDDGLVIVDYKTDAVETLAARVGHYRIQTAAYALAVAEAAGEPVVRCVLTFVAPDGAHEVVFSGADLTDAVASVRELAAAERADPSPLGPLVPADS